MNHRRFAVTTANDPWGRVDADGTVYVRTADGERVIGSWAAGSPEEELPVFRRKFEALENEVKLIEQRLATTEIAPAQAQSTVKRLLAAVADANALGDLDSLRTRLEALTRAGAHRRAGGKAARGRGPPRSPTAGGRSRPPASSPAVRPGTSRSGSSSKPRRSRPRPRTGRAA